MNQTENYVVLKPIAERFSRIANEITDDEIKALIRSTLEEQLKQAVSFHDLKFIVDEYMDDHEEEIKEWTEVALKKRIEKLGEFK